MPIKRIVSVMTSVIFVLPFTLAQNITFRQTDRTIQYPAVDLIQGDINRDGHSDFLFGFPNSLNIFTFKSDGGGGYAGGTIPTSYCPSHPRAVGDFQQNGNNDLLVSSTTGVRCAGDNNDTTFGNYLNDGSGKFHLYKKFPVTGYSAEAAAVADFNSDKKLDAVTVDENIELYYGDGYGSFAGPYIIANLAGTPASLTGSFYNLITGDFDGNGCTDVAWTEYESYGERGYKSQLRVAYGNCRGNFTVITQYDIVGEIDNIHTADLDRDGISDIVASLNAAAEGVTDPHLQISYGRRDRTFTTKLFADPSLTGPIQAADFNGDGYPDIAYLTDSQSGETVKVVEGDADQSFSAAYVYKLTGAADNNPLQMLSGDYNLDGKTDLALLVSGQAGTSDFTVLTNTSPYPDGACAVPATPAIHVCSPEKTSGGTVHVDATATNLDPTVYMELWVDGIKRVGYGSTHELRTTLNLPPGRHRLVYFSSDAVGSKNSVVTYVTVY